MNPENVYLPPLDIKLGLIKNFFKTVDQNSAGYMCLKNTLPRIGGVKIKEGVFFGTQRRELIQDVTFEDLLNEVENAAWKSLKNECLCQFSGKS